MKQTSAVEWLVKELNQKIDFIPMHKWDEIRDIVQQAKAMEKKQIVDAANTLLYRGTGPGDMWAEQYYNETFNKDKQ
jgi:hypothetical protein